MMFPKPIPREKRKTSRWTKKKARRLDRPGADAGRLEFCRSRPCVGVTFFPGHICRGDVEASHARNPIGGLPTGTGRKEGDRKTCPKCAGLHRDWERHRGPFAGWTHEERHYWMADRIAEVNVAWDALPESQRDWWRGEAERKRRLRAEAFRTWA